jgi:thiamine biosynthesis lipoprotein ApbE
VSGLWLVEEATAAPAAASSLKPAPPLAGAEVTRRAELMGGWVSIHLRTGEIDPEVAGRAERDADRALRRIGRWADRLTRHSPDSELSALNADRSPASAVRPTLAAALDWGRAAESLSSGLVDIALLDERLAAEGIPPASAPAASAPWRAWSTSRGRRLTTVHRTDCVRFDLDGVAKGWIADRALAMLGDYEDRVVDADGDIAIAVGAGSGWSIGVADPRNPGWDLAVLRLEASSAGDRFGVATSGTSVHRWVVDGETRHHLIDPRTGRSAVSDVVQATVVAASARAAETLAKTAVILGSQRGMAFLEGADARGVVLLTDRDELLLSPRTLRWLA